MAAKDIRIKKESLLTNRFMRALIMIIVLSLVLCAYDQNKKHSNGLNQNKLISNEREAS